MSDGAGDGTAVSLDSDAATRVADRLTACGKQAASAAGGLDRAMPAVPEDSHDLAGLFVRFDEARERFDTAVGATFSAAGGKLAAVVLNATSTDEQSAFRHLPAAGR